MNIPHVRYINISGASAVFLQSQKQYFSHIRATDKSLTRYQVKSESQIHPLARYNIILIT